MRIEVSPASHNRHRLQFHNMTDGSLLTTDTLDLHNHRQRETLIARLINDHGVDRALIENRMNEVLRQVVAAEEATVTRENTEARSIPYIVHDQSICLADPIPTPLANFTASIVEELIIDDGTMQSHQFNIEGQLWNGQTLPRIRVLAEDFESMD